MARAAFQVTRPIGGRLQSHGYSIVSWSPETGADIFLKESDSLSLFFQGHPEYSTTALLGEYRRDISRFLSGEEDFYPHIPHGYFSANVEVELGKIPGASAVQPQSRPD